MKNELVKCPVCGKMFLKSGIRLHIINKGKNEVFRWALDKTSEIKHFQYVKENTKVVKQKILKLKIK